MIYNAKAFKDININNIRQMIDMNTKDRAIHFAIKAHGEQARKYTGEPYVLHCLEVSNIVSNFGGNMNMYIAAVLHDVLEDTNISSLEIHDEFGLEVMNLVLELSDISVPEDGNRKRRKEIDRIHIARSSIQAKFIKIADVISNCVSIVEHDKDFAVVYLKEMDLLMESIKAGTGEGDANFITLYSLTLQILLNCREMLNEKNS